MILVVSSFIQFALEKNVYVGPPFEMDNEQDLNRAIEMFENLSLDHLGTHIYRDAVQLFMFTLVCMHNIDKCSYFQLKKCRRTR